MEVDRFLKTYNLRGPNFDDTPLRVKRMWEVFFNYPAPRMTTFPAPENQGMILLKEYKDWGFCPHHLLPVEYTFKIGYIPESKILGASKPLRVASFLLRSLPIQEDLGPMIEKAINESIKPKGIGVVISGKHGCMTMRGVSSPCANMVTTYMSGCFLKEQSTREEFLLL